MIISVLHFTLHDKEPQKFLARRNLKNQLVQSSLILDKANEKQKFTQSFKAS